MTIKVNGEYVTLGQLLKITSIVSSGGEAKVVLPTLDITVNGEKENRRGKKLYPGNSVVIRTPDNKKVSINLT